MRVSILSGAPGSGKTTWAAAQPNSIVISADDWFTTSGVYTYDPKGVPAAHAYCLRRYVAYVTHEAISDVNCSKHVIVDNTNTTLVEIAPYARLAQAFGIQADIHYFRAVYYKNIHSVPADKVRQLADRALSTWEDDTQVTYADLRPDTHWVSRTFRCSVLVHGHNQ